MGAPGRNCPLHYRYEPASLASDPCLAADTLYVVGGLYGNRPALEWIAARASREPGPVMMVFNGDFNWFNVDAEGFRWVNETVLRHVALRGNVETEIAGDDAAAGCGCAYPDFVGDGEVERSNRIMERLRATAGAFPEIRARLAALPMHLAAVVGGLRVSIVHGDPESLAGWGLSREAARDSGWQARLASWFAASRARVIASSHTCLPVLRESTVEGKRCVVANNGAAGMPNFRNTRYGLFTRIARVGAPDALYGTRIDGAVVETIALEYDGERFEREFLADWPAGSPAHVSYYHRIRSGPEHDLAEAMEPAAQPA